MLLLLFQTRQDRAVADVHARAPRHEESTLLVADIADALKADEDTIARQC